MRDEGVRGRHQRNIGGDHHIVPDENVGIIQHAEMVVGEEILPDVGVDAVIELHRRLEVEALPDLSQNRAHQPRNAVIVFVQRVDQTAGFMGFVLGVPQLHGIGAEQQPGFDPFGFFHSGFSFSPVM